MADQGTRLETDDDVRRVLQMHRQPAAGRLPAQAATAAADDCPPLFRPTLRPPTPVLVICDDGLESGESVRIRKECFVIGRTEGDVTIPHDSQISSRHAEVRRSFGREKFRWSLVDLGSTNGTYVRVGTAVLAHGQEFIVGSSRLRFENQPAEDAAPPQTSGNEQGTRFWQQPVADGKCPSLVELVSTGTGGRFLLDRGENWLGKDAGHCQIVLSADPLVSARHARLRRQEDGRWVLENNKSVNGVWLRVDQISFKGVCRFMLGEQRFVIHTSE